MGNLGTYIFHWICGDNLENMKNIIPQGGPIALWSPCTPVHFRELLSSFHKLLSSFHALLSSFLSYCPVSSSYCPVFIFLFGLPESRVDFCIFFFSSDIHPSITVYLFFQICTFFPIYWHYTHYARFELFVLLSSSSRYCPVSRATVQFLVLLCSFLMLLSSMLQWGNWTVAQRTRQ